MDAFTILDEENACEVDDPKIDVYKQMAMLSRMGYNYALCVGADGSYTVQGDGLALITFKPKTHKSRRN